MPHITFFYFTGQSIAALFANWWLSLITVSVVGITDLIVSYVSTKIKYYWVDAVGIWIGWFSAFYVPEFVIKIPTLDFAENANKFKVSVNVVIQLFIFIGLTIPLLIVDPTWLLFIITFIVHLFGFIPIFHISYLIPRFSVGKAKKFYGYWSAMVLLTDATFIVMYALTTSVLDTVYIVLATSISTLIIAVLYFKFRSK